MPVWFKRKIIYFPLLFLFLISIVLAVPPFESQIAGGTDILELKVPIVNFIKQNQEGVTLNTHVFNKTNGLQMIPSNSDISCYLHLYNKSGKHILQEEMTANSNDLEWTLDINKENFSLLGTHAYLLRCNNSNTGGFVSGGFEVTETGEENVTTSEDWEDELLIYFVFALSVMLLLFAFWKQDQNLAAISGILMFMLGIYITINGFSAVNTILSLTLGIVFICIGAYIFIRSSMENF